MSDPGLNVLHRLAITRAATWGFIDAIEIDPCGIVRITGWSDGSRLNEHFPDASLDQTPLLPLQVYRTRRPDINSHFQTAHIQAGVVHEFMVPEKFHNQTVTSPSVTISGIGSFQFDGAIQFIAPHFAHLINTSEVLHRNELYGSGPPNMVVDSQLVDLSKFLTGRVLDFGCGSGALLRYLRSNSIDAYGIEMNIELIRNSIQPDVAPFITLYDGTFPTTFANKSFDSLICSEVLEHIPQFEQAVDEFGRLAAKRLVVTVPDMSAIPVGFRHRLIPWHLLEATHVNFFTQISLHRLLKKHFSRVEFGRMSPCRMNEAPFYVSLVAFCEV